MFSLRSVQPGDRDYRLPAYMQGVVLHVMPKEFVIIRPSLSRMEMDLLVARLLSCFSKEEAKRHTRTYSRQGHSEKLVPSPHINILGLLEVGATMNRTRQRVMPTVATFLALADQLSCYRIAVSGGEGEEGERKLEPLEIIALLYYRYRPVVGCGILVRLLTAVALLTCPARDVTRFFASPIVQAVYTCKYTDACLDGEYKQRQVLQEVSLRSTKWEVVVKERFRKALFSTPCIRRNANRQARVQSFEWLAEGLRLPEETKVECLELSDAFMLAYLGLEGAQQLNGQDVNDLMDRYIFHPMPLWSMKMLMPASGDCRIRYHGGELATAAILRTMNDAPTDGNETMADDAESIVTQETEDLQSQLNSSDGEEAGNEENEAPAQPSRRQPKERAAKGRGKKRPAAAENSPEGSDHSRSSSPDSESSEYQQRKEEEDSESGNEEGASGGESDEPIPHRHKSEKLVEEVPVARERHRSRSRSPRRHHRRRGQDDRDERGEERRHRHGQDVYGDRHRRHGDRRHRHHRRDHRDRLDRHGEDGGRHRHDHYRSGRHHKSSPHRDRRNEASGSASQADVPACSIQ